MNYIKEYKKWIKNNPKKVPLLIKLQIDKLISDINQTDGDVVYDAKKANHAIEFIEGYCRNIKGKQAGRLVVLDLWEKAFVASIFGIVYKETGFRRTKRAILFVAKKNGKSLLGAAIGLYMQLADGEGGPECYSIATKRDQAKIIWEVAKKMTKKDRELRKVTRSTVGEIKSDFNDGVFKPLASDADTLDGHDVHFVDMDEVQQWKNGYPLYDIMYRGMDNREQPLALITSTAGTIREDIFDILYEEAKNILTKDDFVDDRSIFFIYELDKKEEWEDFNNLIKANPGLGTIRNEKSLRDEWIKTKNHPDMYLKSFLTKNCNIRETSTESWLSLEDLENDLTFDISKLKPSYVIGGVDMSSSIDLTCVSFLFRVPNDEIIYIHQQFFIPEDVAEEKIKTDKVPYDKWEKQGYVTYCPGNKIEQDFIWLWIYEFVNDNGLLPIWNGFDMWGAELLAKRYKGEFGDNSVEEIKQIFRVLSNPMKELKADLKANRINYNNNPITKWCLGNTVAKMDNKGNIQPQKRYSNLKRIDGTASMLDAYVTYLNHEDDYLNLI